MVDLDSNPTKLIEVVEIGKQLLMTRGALTTFSLANDVAKYFAIIPAAFATTYPQLAALDIMRLTSPSSAIASAVIFNALIIVFLIPLALKGVKYRAVGAAKLLNETAFKGDKAAKVGTYGGAAAGTATSLGALAVAGAGPSGLAAIGSLVGGGMAAGAAAVLAAPVIGAAAVGAGVYFWRKKKKGNS